MTRPERPARDFRCCWLVHELAIDVVIVVLVIDE
jgi:hypothetical protein